MPVGRPQVSIRLGTTGRSDVEKDFAAIGASGEGQARRYAAAWERAGADAERALERQAAAAAKLQSVGATPMQRQINASTGVGSATDGRAKASAAALAQELDHAEREARQLIAAIDPLFAAQGRYAAQVERINAVKASGQLTDARYQQLLAHEKTLLDQSTQAAQRNGAARGQMRMGMQQLGFQLGDISQGLAMGTRASVIFAQQSGQVVQSLQLMGGEGNKFLRFLGGPWGIALSVAAVALTPLIAKLFETEESVGDLTEKMQVEARQSRLNDAAHRAFENTLEGVTEALRKNREALKGLSDEGKTATERALQLANAELFKLDLLKFGTEATIRYTQAQIELNRSRAQVAGMDPRVAGPALADANANEARLKALLESLPAVNRQLDEARKQIADAASLVAVEAGKRDESERIKRTYDEIIEKTRIRLRDEKKTSAEIERQTRLLTQQRDAKLKELQERERKPGPNAGGTAIFDSQIASYFDTAMKYKGLSETRDKGVLSAFFREATGQSIDPEITKWCAAFVNAVLAANGVKGTGSLAAKSFLTFGKDDTKSPQRGDIAVVRTGAGNHVGFVDSVDKAGNVRMLAGNTSDKVAFGTYNKSQILGIRRPPTPAESAAGEQKAVTDALQADRAFESERERLNQQYLQALAQVVRGYDEQAGVQRMRAQAQHDAEAKEIEANLAAGRYGEATSELAQTRAKQLLEANAAVLKERQAAIALDERIRGMKTNDAMLAQVAQFKVDDLEGAEAIARTTKERRQLQLDIIAIQYEEKQRHLEYLLALNQLLGNTEEAAKIAAELAQLPKQRGRDTRAANDNNKTAFEAYRDSLPKNMDEAGEIMQGSVVRGLQAMNDGLTDALMKSENLSDLWKNLGSVIHDFAQQLLKDLLDLAIKMFILKPLMNMIAGGGMGGGFATGTEYFRGGAAWVGENGPELVSLPRGSKIHTAAASRRMAAASNDQGIGSVTINADFRGADAASVDAIQGRLDDMETRMPGMIVATMNDARERFVWRG